MKRLMDKAKTIEWVKLIDYEYSQKDGQSMITIQFRKKYYQKWSLKSQGLKVQVSNFEKSWRCLHNIYFKF